MFDETPDMNSWEDEPSWEDFFSFWQKFLKKCAEYYGLEISKNKLILPEGQNQAMYSHAVLQVLSAKEKLHAEYPDCTSIISRLTY